MNKILVTDMDDVLVDLLTAWTNVLNKRYNKSVRPCDVLDWDMKIAYPDLSDKELYGVLNEEELWKQVLPMNDSPEYLKLINDTLCKVYVCTATHYKNIEKKIVNCLMKYYSWLGYKDIIMCHDKSMLKCDYIVDDNVQNVKNSDGIKFLFDRPHNQRENTHNYDFRVKSMKDVYEIIKEFQEVEYHASNKNCS